MLQQTTRQWRHWWSPTTCFGVTNHSEAASLWLVGQDRATINSGSPPSCGTPFWQWSVASPSEIGWLASKVSRYLSILCLWGRLMWHQGTGTQLNNHAQRWCVFISSHFDHLFLSTREKVLVFVEMAKGAAVTGLTLPWSGFIYVCCAGTSKVDISLSCVCSYTWFGVPLVVNIFWLCRRQVFPFLEACVSLLLC